MEISKMQSVLIIPIEEWKKSQETLQRISEHLDSLQTSRLQAGKINSPYITAKEFMTAVRICRSNFDKLVHKNKIMTLKKGRKVYVVASEVERYFKEVEV